MTRRVLVTGVGPVTSIGIGAEDFHRAQLSGRSGTRHVTRFSPEVIGTCVAGEVDLPPQYVLPRRQVAVLDRFAQLAVVAARLAVEDAAIDSAALERHRVGVVVGTGMGGALTWEETGHAMATKGPALLSPRFITKTMCNNAAAVVAIEHGFSGPTSSPVVACASGAEALVAGHQMIACGEADVVLAGGTEAPIVPALLAGFRKMGALSRRSDDPASASRPFSSDRDGFVLSEGAAMLVLEAEEHVTARGGRVLAEFAGYGRAGDAFHITAPLPDGDGARRALEAALRFARLTPGDVSYVNAHGTGTRFNDAAEVAALRTVLGERAACVPVSSTKSQTGHAIGAAGAIEAVAGIQAIISGMVPPTINLRDPDPELGLDFVSSGAREEKVTAVLSNSFGFGGHNVVLAFTRA